MKKPRPEREVAIRATNKEVYFITFNASPDAITELAEFGRIYPVEGYYELYVDRRYDFDEVVAYIENYGQEAGE